VVLEEAAAHGWRVRVDGAGRWAAGDAPADLALSTRGLTRVVRVSAPDLVATVEAGIAWPDLRRALADHGTWLPWDPPGTDRTLGSIISSATSGPLRSGHGSVRDHLLGLTMVTGQGRVIRPGGRVVKNVAGFDLTRLAAGSFGAFGVITTVHLRLRAVPRADITLVRAGKRDQLLQLALAIREAGEAPAALELASPGVTGRTGWTLAIRLLGSEAAVAEARRAVAGAAGTLEELAPAAGAAFWAALAANLARGPVTLRLGALAPGLADSMDLVAHHLDDECLTATVAGGALRWSGSAPADRVRLLRAAAAQRELPLTVERAPWETLTLLGHFGAYREGVGRLVDSLRRTFDPTGVLVFPAGEG
jgi:FAD/FMN-containing dehydrogenase